MKPLLLVVALIYLLANHQLLRAGDDTSLPDEPEIAEASPAAELALKGFKVPPEWESRLFAAEPLVANPVSFTIDYAGRVFVCESFRQGRGVTDNRKHDQRWLDADLAAQTVADRLKYHKKQLGEKISLYTKYDDRLRLIEDRDHDGMADYSTVFAKHFNQVVDGTGAGVLTRGNDVFFTCIPHLWRLRDLDGDGRSDQRHSLHSGFGVRVAFRGHDLHGLIMGPDGKLYFSIGDRGYNVKTGQRHYANPESGAIFRCNLDGGNLEVIHTGLRNPQELAFDDFGNLFTGDNNSDSGDKARWVYIVEGGDSGWRMPFQYLPDRGPWNREKLWHPPHPEQAAYLTPPITNLADGPSGLAFYPGTGLSEHYRGRFFLCDFRGTPSRSGVRTFRVESQGAFFKVVDQEQTLWKILATDIQFAPDGKVYVSDWVNGWNGLGKGRIYTFYDPTVQQHPVVDEVPRILSQDMTSPHHTVLAGWLAHPDRRVRMEAQFALAARNNEATLEILQTVATEGEQLLGRVHAIWGLGQVLESGTQTSTIDGVLAKLFADPHPEIRAQAARMAGRYHRRTLRKYLVAGLRDASPRMRYFSAIGLSHTESDQDLPAIAQMLIENNDADPMLRHAGIMALAAVKNSTNLEPWLHHDSPSVRLALVVALRKQKNPGIARFLNDSDPRIVREAALAIHDMPIPQALPQLADLIRRPAQDDALLRRVLNANYRLGDRGRADAIVRFAKNSEVPQSLRLEALQMLASWKQPGSRDRVLGAWRPIAERDPQQAVAALEKHLPGLLTGPPQVREQAIATAATLEIRQIAPKLHQLLEDKTQGDRLRADALGALESLGDQKLSESAQRAIRSRTPHLRNQGRAVLARLDPRLGVPLLEAAIESTNVIERQGALQTLGTLADPRADTLLLNALDRLTAGQVPLDSQLDVILAAKQRDNPIIGTRIKALEQDQNEPLHRFQLTLHGGSPERGREVFQRTNLSCQRCHQISKMTDVVGQGGRVGPDLSQSSSTWNKLDDPARRTHLLESIVAPSRTISKEFQSIVITTVAGKVLSGVQLQANATHIVVGTAQGQRLTVLRNDIDQISASQKSAMPDDLWQRLPPQDMRDLIAFLLTIR